MRAMLMAARLLRFKISLSQGIKGKSNLGRIASSGPHCFRSSIVSLRNFTC
jgi:hypothetical protein